MGKKEPERDSDPGYGSVSLPREITNELDALIGKHGYRSRADVVVDAIRQLLRGLSPEKRGAA
jgi:metal-responsive CopG/Arc/MetJ family transcriptional regulator